ALGAHRLQQRTGVAHGGDHVEAVVAQQALQAVAQQREILGDHYSHGSSARTVVGPPGGLMTRSVPSSASTRRRKPLSPPPSASAPPLPSSWTSTESTPSPLQMRTSTRRAPECLPALASASATTK